MPPVGNNFIKRSFKETDSVTFGLNDGLGVGLIRGLYVRFGFGVGVAVGRGINSGKIGFTVVGFGVGRFVIRGFAFGALPFLPSMIIWPSWV
jgi:hypothetical protein